MAGGYITQGIVRGRCPHLHRTIQTAARCLDHDSDFCHARGSYSDRVVMRRTSTGHIRILSKEEFAVLETVLTR